MLSYYEISSIEIIGVNDRGSPVEDGDVVRYSPKSLLINDEVHVSVEKQNNAEVPFIRFSASTHAESPFEEVETEGFVGLMYRIVMRDSRFDAPLWSKTLSSIASEIRIGSYRSAYNSMTTAVDEFFKRHLRICHLKDGLTNKDIDDRFKNYRGWKDVLKEEMKHFGMEKDRIVQSSPYNEFNKMREVRGGLEHPIGNDDDSNYPSEDDALNQFSNVIDLIILVHEECMKYRQVR